MMKKQTYVGMDVHKESISIAIADAGRDGEIRFYGKIDNTPGAIKKLVTKLSKMHGQLEFTYEAGPCGYNIYRQLQMLRQNCTVVAPSRIAKSPTDRIKNDTRDAITLARLNRAGELTQVWVPDESHEAMRDLVRARHAANQDLKIARQRIQSFLLKYDMRYGKKSWTGRHKTWMANLQFPLDAQQIAFQNYINAMEQALARREQIENEIRELLPSWNLAPVVENLQALRGVALVIAVTLVAEVGDISRFDNPRQLMAFLGLVPGEHSSGGKTRHRGITKTGNKHMRSLLYEAAWSYRHKAKVGAYMLANLPKDLPQQTKDIAWKAQLRLTKRYRRLTGRGKKSQVAITAVARELIGFMWAIANSVHISREIV